MNGDTNVELDETFLVNLSAPVNATINDAQGQGTIQNDDATPAVSKIFNPNTITIGQTSIVTLGLDNPNATPMTLTADFIDDMPIGMTAVSVNAGTTCPDVIDISNNTEIRYSIGSIVPVGGCNIAVDVTSSTVGVSTNICPANSLQTNFGTNLVGVSDNLIVIGDTDGDGINDVIESCAADRDGDGATDCMDFDPLGYFYCEDTGQIIPGGNINFTAAGAGTINLIEDGSSGRYQAFFNGDDTYTMNVTVPPGTALSPTRTASILFDPTGGPDPTVLGGDEAGNSGFLTDFTAATNVPWYTSFVIEAGDPFIIDNNIPLTNCAVGGANNIVLLTKTVEPSEITIGDVAQYSVRVENTSAAALVDIDLVDNIPGGFNYVDSSAILIRAGADGILDTSDDIIDETISVTGGDPITFQNIDIDANETALIRYFLRVSSGVVEGEFTNTVQALSGTGAVISNVASATIRVIQDPIFQKTTIIGKVFHDRDEDGWQDDASATGIRLEGNAFGDQGREIENISGRIRVTDPVEDHQTIIRVPTNNYDNSFTLTTREGTKLIVDNEGVVTEKHSGKKAKGLTAQDIVVTVSKTSEVSRKPQVREIVLDRAIEPIRFESGHAEVGEQTISALRLVMDGLRNKENLRLHIFGHTDNQPVGNRSAFVNNQELSQMRAEFVASQLSELLKLPVSSIVVEGVGDSSPLVDNATNRGRALNRRVEIEIVYDEKIEHVQEQVLDELVITIANHGIQEEGIPGVRLATVEGLIVETDQYGRYHLADIDGGRWERGRNFIVKVDSATLPEGATFTTENPRVLRITQALMSKFNFGVKLPNQDVPKVTITLDGEAGEMDSKVHFASGQSNLTAAQQQQVSQLIEQLQGKENVRVRIVGHADADPLSINAEKRYSTNVGLSSARSKEVKQQIVDVLGVDASAITLDARGVQDPVANNSTQLGKAQNRRVEVEVWYDEAQVERTITLPHGGVVWATEDPAVMDPRLNIVAPTSIVLEGRNVRDPIQFTLYSNYQAFIDRWEIAIYEDRDRDLVRPIAKLNGNSIGFADPVEWSASEIQKLDLEVDDTLVYVLKVYDAQGRMDETAPHTLAVINDKLAELEERETLFSREDEEQNSINTIFGESSLIRQTIPLYGSRIRISGVDIDPDYKLLINGERAIVDEDGKFVVEQHMPIGKHAINISVDTNEGDVVERELNVDVSGKYMFMIGLANLTASEQNVSGNVEPLGDDDHFDEDVVLDGRLAFYLKGKIKGKYLITAQLDTTEDELHNLGDRLEEEDPTEIFRRLDPDKYYGVYGDDSTTIDDTDSQGAFYLRVDWDKSMGLWGNYNTGFTGTEFAQYNRSLYGAKLEHRNVKVTKFGDHKHEVQVFGSEAQTAAAHNEFGATGGSLYYLRDTDVVQGSEKIWVEVRARDSEQVVENITLEHGRDYDIDYIQGRIILTRPLTQISVGTGPSIIKDTPLEGNDVFLLADYEYRPDVFSADDVTTGGRGKAWLNDYVALGGTYVNEDRDGADYELKGTDVTLRAGKGTYLKLEYAESEAKQADQNFSSANGGISFNKLNTQLGNVDGEALGAEIGINFAEVTDHEGYLKAWWKDRDSGFSSTARLDDGIETTDTGLEALWIASERLELSARATQLDRKGQNEFTALSIQGDYQVTNKLSIGTEIRHEEDNDDTGFIEDGEATLAGTELRYDLTDYTTVYGGGQFVVEDSGNYEQNDLTTIGIQSQVSERFALRTEISAGDRGEAIILGGEYDITPNLNISLDAGFGSGGTSQVGTNYTTANGLDLYGGYATDPDRADGGSNMLTFGTRKRYQNGLSIYSENQFGDGDEQQSVARTYGLDFDLTEEWRLSASFQKNDIEDDLGDIDRRAASLGASYRDDDLKFGTVLEYREDDNKQVNEDATQWLTSNTIEWQQSESLRWLGKLELSTTHSEENKNDEAKYAELDLGFAYRPAFNDRLNILGKYTFLYDLASDGQDTALADQRSHIFAVEGIYDLTKKWEVGAKVAYKTGDRRIQRGSGTWFETGAHLAVARARYHMLKKWDALFEYRWLESEERDDNKDGALLGVYRHVGQHMKVGAGYNFTDFDDDLTDNDYDAHGWFFDITGKY
ncbi:MAG: OmpA family protein [Gammaproteobacteria bacterium]